LGRGSHESKKITRKDEKKTGKNQRSQRDKGCKREKKVKAGWVLQNVSKLNKEQGRTERKDTRDGEKRMEFRGRGNLKRKDFQSRGKERDPSDKDETEECKNVGLGGSWKPHKRTSRREKGIREQPQHGRRKEEGGEEKKIVSIKNWKKNGKRGKKQIGVYDDHIGASTNCTLKWPKGKGGIKVWKGWEIGGTGEGT